MKIAIQKGFFQDKMITENKTAQLKKPGKISKRRKIILSFSSLKSGALLTLR